jgi:uncharacterized caspase-like protein
MLTALARGPDASGISDALTVQHVNPAKQPVLHLVPVGISTYQEPALKLQYATADARAVADAFKKHSCGAGRFFREAKGEPILDYQANREGLLQALTLARKAARPNDLAVVFFAGHGVKLDKEYYLLTVESDMTNLPRTAVSGTELRKALADFPCQVLLMLDACHSAAGAKAFRPATDDLTRSLTDDDVGVAVLCAAMGHEKAAEKAGNGLFTRALLETLEKAKGHSRTGRLFVHHLHSNIYDRVSEESDDRQHPFLSLPWVVESFAVR